MHTPENRPQPLLLRCAEIMPHPAVAILLWVFLAIGLQSVHVAALLLTGGILTACALAIARARFHAILRRTRWVMFSLLMIYAYVTPGDPMWQEAGAFSPTWPGIADGMLQLCRLAFSLAGLCVLLRLLSQQQLMAGLYALAYPLRYLGLPRERATVRLALTLHYAETAMVDVASGWRSHLERMLNPAVVVDHPVVLTTMSYRRRDAIVMVAGVALLALSLM